MFPAPTGFVAGVPFSATATDASQGNLTWSLSGQPTWLTVGGASGVVSGMPTGAGSASFELTGIDAFGRSDKVGVGPVAVAAPYATMAAMPARVRAGTDLNSALATNVTPGAWSLSVAPQTSAFSLSGEAVSGLAPAPATETAYTLTVTRASSVPGATAQPSASGTVTVVPPLAAAAPSSYSVASRADVGASALAPTALNALSPTQVRWKLADSSGALPQGVTVDAATGKLQGFVGSYASATTFPDIRLVATDSDRGIAETPTGFTLTVQAQTSTKTFSTVNKSPFLSLTNDNLTLYGAGSRHAVALTNVVLVSGDKKYYEVRLDALGDTSSNNAFIGFSTQGRYDVYLGTAGTSSIGLSMTNGQVYGSSGAKLGPIAVGSVIMIAVDAAQGLVWYGINGTWNGVPGTATGSYKGSVAAGSSPAVSLVGPTSRVTISIDGTSYPAPAGFSTF